MIATLPIKSSFPLGDIVVTAAVRQLLSADEINTALARHAAGDWGNVSFDDAEANEVALIEGHRLISSYGKRQRRFWIVTDWDRSKTTVLMPASSLANVLPTKRKESNHV